MIKDKIKLYSDFSEFKDCDFCGKQNHLPVNCPKFFYAPDKDFHIKKFIYSQNQERKQNIKEFSKKKRMHALKNLTYIQNTFIKYQENTCTLDDIVDEEGIGTLNEIEEAEESNKEEELEIIKDRSRNRKETQKKATIVLKDSKKEILWEKRFRNKPEFAKDKSALLLDLNEQNEVDNVKFEFFK